MEIKPKIECMRSATVILSANSTKRDCQDFFYLIQRCLQKHERFRAPQDAVIDAFITYPGRDLIHRAHDLALIKFEDPVYFGNFVRPACIVPQSFDRVKRATVSGWGITTRSKCRRNMYIVS